MFILEEPYVSRLLLDTLSKNGYEVLGNDFIKNNAGGYKLNFVSENEAREGFKDKGIYSNSENSIKFILENFSDSNTARAVELCKDKCKFRYALQSLYPGFFHKEIFLDELDDFKFEDAGKPFIIKPAVGFLSLGVHKVRSNAEWLIVKNEIISEIAEVSKLFPKSVVDVSKFIIEEILEGAEFAVDIYYDNEGVPCILNILSHPFLDAEDVSDRAYITSAAIIRNNLKRFENMLEKIGKTLGLKNFPMHIELILGQNGDITPVEINPLRFAGWCTTDLAYFAYGINIYEYFAEQKKPDWDSILSRTEDKIFYFAMAERPKELQNVNMAFDYEELYKNFSNILEKREINNPQKPVCAVIFGSCSGMDEVDKILKLDMKSFVKRL